MNTQQNETTLEELVARLTELERANTRMSEELLALRAERPIIIEQATLHTKGVSPQGYKQPKENRQGSRRRLLRKGLGIAAASVGAGALFGMNAGIAHADGTEGPTTFNNNGGSSPAVTANSTSPASSKVNAIIGDGGSGYTGIAGFTSSNDIRASGVFGQGGTVGVAGQVQGATSAPIVKVGVYGTGSNGSNLGWVGVEGESDTSNGVIGLSKFSTGVAGFSLSTTNDQAAGILGEGRNGVIGQVTGATIFSNGHVGVYGTASNGSNLGGTGVQGDSDTGFGVRGTSQTLFGVKGEGDGANSVGVFGEAFQSGSTGVFGSGNNGAKAGVFSGDVDVTGTLTKGGGSFKIDHPLDPANKYLYHSFVESPDMKNVYDGVVTLDANGEAKVTLPSWFEVLNTDFRYQLTPIGAAGPNLHIAVELSNLSFKIAGGTAGMKVSWQVTGIRQDAWAQANRIPVEQNKLASERGNYLYPKLYGHPSDPSITELPYAEKVSRFEELHR